MSFSSSFLVFWDKASRSFVLAVRSLWLHKLRAFLSVLGIIIGTGAVISLMAFGEGSMQDALDDIKRQGATNIIVRSVKPPDESFAQGQSRSFVASYGLTVDDYDRFRLIDTVVRHVPLRVFRQEIRYLGRVQTGRVVGTTPEYALVHKFNVTEGRFLTHDDDEGVKNHAVIGSDLAQKLFPFEEALGQSIVIGKHLY